MKAWQELILKGREIVAKKHRDGIDQWKEDWKRKAMKDSWEELWESVGAAVPEIPCEFITFPGLMGYGNSMDFAPCYRTIHEFTIQIPGTIMDVKGAIKYDDNSRGFINQNKYQVSFTAYDNGPVMSFDRHWDEDKFTCLYMALGEASIRYDAHAEKLAMYEKRVLAKKEQEYAKFFRDNTQQILFVGGYYINPRDIAAMEWKSVDCEKCLAIYFNKANTFMRLCKTHGELLLKHLNIVALEGEDGEE